ncbi:MAG: hypothetical protein ABIC96_01975 [Patescibacteria group bacterium]
MTLEQRAELPSGYLWKDFPGMNARFPMPDTWFFLALQVEDTRAFFLTREAVTKQGIYTTGLSINILPRIKVKTGRPATEMAIGLMKTLPLVPTSRITIHENDPLFICRRFFILPVATRVAIPSYRGGFVEKAMEPTNFYVQTVANRDTDTAYIIQFETPSRIWNDDKETAKTMIENGVLDKTI